MTVQDNFEEEGEEAFREVETPVLCAVGAARTAASMPTPCRHTLQTEAQVR
jgi:hypothetical protein